MKKSKRSIKITIIVATSILIVAGIILALALTISKAPVKVAYYALTDMQKTALTKSLSAFSENEGKKQTFTFTELNADKPLAEQANNKFDIVFAPLGKNTSRLVNRIAEKNTKNISLPQTVLEGATISVHQASLKDSNNFISAVPLLLDNNEIAIDKEMMNVCGIKTISNWHDIELFAFTAKKKIKQPIIFAGSDSDTFLGIVGSMTEALSGKQAYDILVSTLTKSIDEAAAKGTELTTAEYDELIKSLSKNADAPLYNTVQLLSRWYKLQLLNSEVFNMTKKDVSAFMEMKEGAIVFMTLSQHREIEHTAIQRYSSIYYPSEHEAVQRYFNASVISAIPLSKNKIAHSAIEELASTKLQEQLSKDAGLAPVQANCRVADHQADDVRYWIAATNAPVAPLGLAVFVNKNAEDTFAKELANFIHYMQ